MPTFPKSKRLTKQLEFKKTLDLGTKVVCPNLILIGRVEESANARIGLIVSRKVGNAVARNYIKRSLREHFRQCSESLPALDLVVIARHTLSKCDGAQISQEFDDCFGRLMKRMRLSVPT